MKDHQRVADIETLARMAARLAGRDPDEHLTIRLAKVIAFDDVIWRYPDFLARAEAAYHALSAGKLSHPSLPNDRKDPAADPSARRQLGVSVDGPSSISPTS